MNNLVYIGLGSNIGNRYEFLKEAILELNTHPTINLVNASSIYETDPVGFEDQESFLNMVIKVETGLKPLDLLNVCHKIEQKLGRKRVFRWGPRTVDLDILLYNQENMITEEIVIPHPRMHERAFVIIPLIEIDAKIKLPLRERLLIDVLKDIPDREGVRIWKQKNGEDVFALFEN